MDASWLKVEIYKNSNRKCWSVRAYTSKKVIGHVDRIHIDNAKFHVQPGGRARVLREGVKNVHAFVTGTLVSANQYYPDSWGYSEEIVYDPYMHSSFVEKGTNVPVHTRPHIYFDAKGKLYSCSSVHSLNYVEGAND